MEYKNFFELAKKRKITNIQITEITNNDILIKYINEKLDINDSCFKVSYNIKAEKNNKTVKITSDYIDEKILDYIEMKLEYTDTVYEDEYLANKNNNTVKNKKIDLINEQETIKKIYQLKEKSKYLKTIDTEVAASFTKIRIINNNGVDISTANESYNVGCELLLEEENTTVSYSKSQLKAKKQELDIIKLVQDSINEAEKMIKKENITTGKYNIVLSNEVTSSIISTIMGAVAANAIRQKTSIFTNKIGKKIMGENVTIIEDPQNKKYPGYTLFDNEGTRTNKKTIIKKGKLETYLYDIKEAKIAKKQSTGNSFEGINTRNLYLVPGKNSKEELFAQMKDGLYITDYMGSQSTSINTNTGNISLQVFGFIIENGNIKCGFEPCVMTTTIEEIFNSIEEIGNDLEFFSSNTGSPSILVKNISIAGK